MPFVYFGVFVAATVWLFWILAWFLVWAIVMLAWPIALVLGAVLGFRALTRRPRHKRAAAWSSWKSSSARRDDVSENSAFEEYRAETLRGLDEEQGRFRDFLDRMRRSRDKHEFDAYMAARRGRAQVIDAEAPRTA